MACLVRLQIAGGHTQLPRKCSWVAPLMNAQELGGEGANMRDVTNLHSPL